MTEARTLNRPRLENPFPRIDPDRHRLAGTVRGTAWPWNALTVIVIVGVSVQSALRRQPSLGGPSRHAGGKAPI